MGRDHSEDLGVGGKIILARILGKYRRDGSVSIALGYGLHDRGSERLWGVPSLLSSGYHGALSLGVKAPAHEADHLLPSSAEVKNAWSYTSTPLIRLHGVVLS
jgi:hypothetical protein